MSSLCSLTTGLTKGTISLADACRQAREIVAGTQRSIVGLPPTLVLPSTSDMQRNLVDLQARMSQLSKDDVEKWAGTLMIVHAQLALGLFGQAVALVKSVAGVSGGRCPEAAQPLAVAMIDTLLAQSQELSPGEIEFLETSRKSFLRSGKG